MGQSSIFLWKIKHADVLGCTSQHGDLTAAHPSVAASSSLLHTIHLKDTPDGQTASELTERLELGASGAGVIGRMLSVVDGGREIGHGVIGWN